jgi:glycerophosphoryl diester phosphodiesterase
VWLPTGLLALDLSDPAAVIAVAVDGGHRALNPWNMMTTGQLVEDAHDAGLEVNVWTVDDPDEIRRLAALNVDSLITNFPKQAREALESDA